MQKQYNVEVCRTGWGGTTLTVMAESEEEAKSIALQRAGDIYFSEQDADYEVVSVLQKETELAAKVRIRKARIEVWLSILEPMRDNIKQELGAGRRPYYYVDILIRELQGMLADEKSLELD